MRAIPADNYKSDHVHVVRRAAGSRDPEGHTTPDDRAYILSSTGGSTPIQRISKFFNTQLRDQIIANTGAPVSKHLTSHVLRRTEELVAELGAAFLLGCGACMNSRAEENSRTL